MHGISLDQKEVKNSCLQPKIGPKSTQFATSVAGRWVAARVAPQAGAWGLQIQTWLICCMFGPCTLVAMVWLLILTRKPPNLVFRNLRTFTNMVMSSDNFALNRKAMKFDVDAFSPSSTVLAITFSYVDETSRNFNHIF